MTLQMNTFSGATNTLRRPWYECFLFYLLSFNCQCKETSIFMFSTFEISTTGRTPGAPKEESWENSKSFLDLIPTFPRMLPRALPGCFRGGENARNTTWAVNVNKICVIRWTFSRPYWDFRLREWSKNSLRWVTLGIKPLTLHLLLMRFISIDLLYANSIYNSPYFNTDIVRRSQQVLSSLFKDQFHAFMDLF